MIHRRGRCIFTQFFAPNAAGGGTVCLMDLLPSNQISQPGRPRADMEHSLRGKMPADGEHYTGRTLLEAEDAWNLLDFGQRTLPILVVAQMSGILLNVSSLKQEEASSLSKRVASDCRKRSLKQFPTKRTCSRETSTPMKPDKKLGNVLAPRILQARKPRSYLELYRRRFSEPQYNARSPEGSTLSVFGDSQQEQRTDEDTCLPCTPRDDRSELSFYRRLIKGFTDCTVTTVRSSGTLHQHVSEDTNSSHSQHAVKGDAISNKSKRIGYRPYTIEEYKTLPIPNLDRSLGPDKVETQAKREWLMRRRSYGNSVSAHNRQRIVLQAQKMKSLHSTLQKCSLPPLKDKEVDVKTQDDSISSTIFEDPDAISQNRGTNCSECSKWDVDVGKISSSEKSKKFQRERPPSFSFLLNSRENSYLESLRQRHLYEKEMVDRIIRQTVCP